MFAEVFGASQDALGVLEQLAILLLQSLFVVGTFAGGNAANLARDPVDVLEQVLVLTPSGQVQLVGQVDRQLDIFRTPSSISELSVGS